MEAGDLRHRLVLQRRVPAVDSAGDSQDENGAPLYEWEDFARLWAKVSPLSARDLLAAQQERSNVTARIKIRYRSDIDTMTMRLYHPAKNVYYHMEGRLADRETGLDYLTLPVSEGVREP